MTRSGIFVTRDAGHATAVVPSGLLIVVAPDGSRVVRAPAAGGRQLVISPRGLPNGVTALSMIDAKVGRARWANGACRPGAKACTSGSGMVITRDGGRTWAPANPR
jgi:hypothetical protein